MNIDDPGFEPELRSPPPRVVRPKLRARFVTGLFATLGLFVPLGLAIGAYFAQQHQTALLDHGRKATAVVGDKFKASDSKSLPSLSFVYQVEGQEYRLVESRSREIWAQAHVGDAEQIVYLPEHPGTSITATTLAKEGATSSTAVALLVVAAILTAFSVPFWIWVSFKQRRLRGLARDGLPLRGTLLQAVPYGASKYDQWRIQYEFTLNGETKQAKTYGDGAMVRALPPLGGPVTVLYDPFDPGRYEFYPVIARMYAVEPDPMAVAMNPAAHGIGR